MTENDLTDLEKRNWGNLVGYFAKQKKMVILPDLRNKKQKMHWAKLRNRRQKLLDLGVQNGSMG